MCSQDQTKPLVYLKKIFLFFLLVMVLQGCQGDIPMDVSIEIPLKIKSGGQPYLLLSEEKKSRVINLNGFYGMEDLIPDLAVEKEFSIADHEYTITSLFGQVPAANHDLPEKKLYEYYLEVCNSERELVDLSYLHRDTEQDWSIIFDKNFSQLNQEGYCLLSFEEPTSGVDCLVRGNYSLLCRSGEKTDGHEVNQAIVITTTRLMVGNREHLEGGRVLGGTEGGEYLLTARVIDWNLDGCFDHQDQVVFPNLAPEQYYPLGEKIEIPSIDLIISPYGGQINKRRYLLKLTSVSGKEGEYVLKIQSRG